MEPVRPDDESTERIPRLLRLLGLHLALGIAFGTAFASLLMMTDSGGLRTLIGTTSEPYLALAALYVMCALTFGSVLMGIGVMTLPWGEPCDMRDPGKKNGDGG